MSSTRYIDNHIVTVCASGSVTIISNTAKYEKTFRADHVAELSACVSVKVENSTVRLICPDAEYVVPGVEFSCDQVEKLITQQDEKIAAMAAEVQRLTERVAELSESEYIYYNFNYKTADQYTLCLDRAIQIKSFSSIMSRSSDIENKICADRIDYSLDGKVFSSESCTRSGVVDKPVTARYIRLFYRGDQVEVDHIIVFRNY